MFGLMKLTTSSYFTINVKFNKYNRKKIKIIKVIFFTERLYNMGNLILVLIVLFDVLLFFLSFLGFTQYPELLLGIDITTSLIYGIITGLLISLIGYVLLIKCRLWSNSMTFLLGGQLTKGSLFTLLRLSLAAGIFEEIYTRGILLILYNIVFARMLTIHFVFIYFAINIIWALGHVLHRKKELDIDTLGTLIKALPHLVIVFISSIPFALLVYKFDSLLPAMVAHFTLDFVFGVLYRISRRTLIH